MELLIYGIILLLLSSLKTKTIYLLLVEKTASKLQQWKIKILFINLLFLFLVEQEEILLHFFFVNKSLNVQICSKLSVFLCDRGVYN